MLWTSKADSRFLKKIMNWRPNGRKGRGRRRKKWHSDRPVDEDNPWKSMGR